VLKTELNKLVECLLGAMRHGVTVLLCSTESHVFFLCYLRFKKFLKSHVIIC